MRRCCRLPYSPFVPDRPPEKPSGQLRSPIFPAKAAGLPPSNPFVFGGRQDGGYYFGVGILLVDCLFDVSAGYDREKDKNIGAQEKAGRHQVQTNPAKSGTNKCHAKYCTTLPLSELY